MVASFNIDKRKRRQIAPDRITSTTGGKVAVAVTVMCLVLTIAVPTYIAVFTADAGVTEDWPFDGILLTGIPLLALTIIAAGATWRQRTAGVTVRKDEQLLLNGTMLEYSFHPSMDRWPHSRHIVMVDLGASHVVFDPRETKYVYNGGIRWHRYLNPGQERLLSYQEMEPVESFEIGAYFGADFDSLMSTYCNNREMGA